MKSFSLIHRFSCYVLLLASAGVVVLGCAPTRSSSSGSGDGTIAEVGYCSQASSYSDSITVTGTAIYNRRAYTSSSGAGLGAVEASPGGDYPIRRAEVVVKNQAGEVVQCGETNGSGQFSLVVPRTNAQMTLAVRSRGANSYTYASVLDAPQTNVPYELTQSFTASATQSLGTLTAPATGTLLGGAFNIFDQILRANIFLAAQTAGCGSFVSGCSTFSPTIKIQAYWKKGFNPGEYVGSSSGLSFYMSGEKRLYILGGIGGDVDNSDTDHFDNTIIIHEYGHFLEDQYSKTDSPGGFHSGMRAIDPRLAWSEGFANYLGLAVTGDTIYRDTIGNVDGSTNGYGVYVDAKGGLLNGPPGPGSDPSYRGTAAGQGNFKEFAIASFLWDATVTTGANYISPSTFGELWSVFTGPFRTSSAGFRDVGLLMALRAGVTGATTATTYDTRLGVLNMRRDRQDYARPLALGSCSNISWSYGFDSYNFFTNLRTYQYNHPGGALSLTLDFISGTPSSPDLDLYLMNQSHTIVRETLSGYALGLSGAVGLSNQNPATSLDETINLSNFAAGSYLIVVHAATSSGSATYRLQVTNSSATGATACPQ